MEAAKRVARGAKTRENPKPVATHTARQKGQVTSAPTARRRPRPRTFSDSSAGPERPAKRVKGARSGLVTGSLARKEPAQLVRAHREEGQIGEPDALGQDMTTPAQDDGEADDPGQVDAHDGEERPHRAIRPGLVRLLLLDRHALRPL